MSADPWLWTSGLPGHWVVMPLKRWLLRSDSGAWGMDPGLDDERLTVVLRSTEQTVRGTWNIDEPASRSLSDAERSATLLLEGDLLVTKSSGSPDHIGKTTLVDRSVADLQAGFSNFMQRLRLRPNSHPKFVWYLLNSSLVRQQFSFLSTTSSGLANLNAEIIGNVVAPAPPLEEQRSIAAFLDYETARIDELVREQERLLELLVEERASIVSRATLDENESITKARLGYFVDLLSGFAFPSERFSHDIAETRLLRGANVGVGAVRWDDVVFWRSDQLVGLERFLLEEGDIVLGMDRPWISTGTRVAEVGNSDIPALLVQRVARMRARNGLSQRFLQLVLESKEFQASIEADLTGVSVPHISSEQILSFRFPLISLAEQERRVVDAEERLAGLESTSREVAAMMALLQERRSALISAAVSGQLDLRDWQPPKFEAIAEVA